MSPDSLPPLAWGAVTAPATALLLGAVSPRRWPRSAQRDSLVMAALACAAASAAMAGDTGYPSLILHPGIPEALVGFALVALPTAWLRSLVDPCSPCRLVAKTVLSVGVATVSLLASLPLLFFNLPGAAAGGSVTALAAVYCARAVFDRLSRTWAAFCLGGAVGLLTSAVLLIPLAVVCSVLVALLHEYIRG